MSNINFEYFNVEVTRVKLRITLYRHIHEYLIKFGKIYLEKLYPRKSLIIILVFRS